MRRLVSCAFLNLLALSSVVCYNSDHYHDNFIKYGNQNSAHLLTDEYSPQHSHDDSPNLKVFYYGERPPARENVMKNLNLGYLNVQQPISSLADLYSMSSEEIGVPLVPTPRPNLRKQPKLWNLDEVSKLGPPQVLPDVGLNLGPDPYDYPVNPVPQVLDDYEVKLGRRVVDDVPRPTGGLNRENYLRQEVKDMGRKEIGETYPRSPVYYKEVPSVVVSNVVQRREPTFMEELQAIKMNKNQNNGLQADFCEAPNYVEADSIQNNNPRTLYMNEPDDIEVDNIQIDKSKPIFEKTAEQTTRKKCHNDNPLPLYIDELKQLMNVIPDDNPASDFVDTPNMITMDNTIENEKSSVEVTTNEMECHLNPYEKPTEHSTGLHEYSTVCPAHGKSTENVGNVTVELKPKEIVLIADVTPHKPVEHTSPSSKQRRLRKRPRKHKTRTPQTTPQPLGQSQEEKKPENE